MQNKMLNKQDEEPRHKQSVISARKAASLIGLSPNTFMKGLEGKVLIPQARIDGEKRPSYGFEKDYITEIAVHIPRDLAGGQTVFTPEVRAAIKEINIKWAKKYPLMRES